MMKKLYLAMAGLFLWSAVASLISAAGNKVPDDISVQIRNTQLDQSRLQTQILQIQQQYTNDQAKLESLKAEALAACTKQDATTGDVDMEKLECVPKPKPAPEVKK